MHVTTNKVILNKRASPLVRNPTPHFDDIWSIAAINTDAFQRKDIVRYWEDLGNKVAEYVSFQEVGLKNPAILCFTDLSLKQRVELFFTRLNQNDHRLRYGHVIETLIDREDICVCCNENLWTKTDIIEDINNTAGFSVSAYGYSPLNKGSKVSQLLLFVVHLPQKRGRELARNLLMTAIIEYTALNSEKKGGLPNPPKRFRRNFKASKGVQSSKKRIKKSTEPFQGSAREGSAVG